MIGSTPLHILFGDSNRYIEIATGDILELYMVESINTVLPSLKMHILDRNNTLIEALLALSTPTLNIRFGEDSETFNQYAFTISNFKAVKYSKIDGKSSVVELYGVLAVDNMLTPEYCRSFNFVSTSSIADTIGTDCNLTKDIDDSVDSQNWLQPRWTNLQMLNYLASKATAKDADKYVAYVTFDKKLHYKDINTLISNSIACTYKEDAHTMYGGLKAGRERAVLDWDIQVVNLPLQIQGAAGETAYWYDYMTNEQRSYGLKPSTLERASLTKTYMVNAFKENENNRSLYEVRTYNSDRYPKSIIDSDIINKLENMVKISIMVIGQKDIHCGDKVHTILLDMEGAGAINTRYSGDWLVESVTQYWAKEYFTKLRLTRAGLELPKDVGEVLVKEGASR